MCEDLESLLEVIHRLFNISATLSQDAVSESDTQIGLSCSPIHRKVAAILQLKCLAIEFDRMFKVFRPCTLYPVTIHAA